MRVWIAPIAVVVGACTPATTPVGVTPPRPPPIAAAPSATPEALYLPEQALADAVSGPLQLVGIGNWPDDWLACVYRNERVFVVDSTCRSPKEGNAITVHVFAPGKGRATIRAGAAVAISTVKRDAYTLFAVGSMLPRPAPAALALDGPYEGLVAYETVETKAQMAGTCSVGTERPAPTCTPGMPTTLPAYTDQTAAFLATPPDAWYDLVRTLVAQRAQAHASTPPGSLSPDRFRAWGLAVTRELMITPDSKTVKHVGNSEGIFSPFGALPDGGAVVVGIADPAPTVVRFDATGKQVWLKSLANKGFKTHEDTSLHASVDGVLVHAQGYPNPGWKAVHRLIKLDARGGIAWETAFRGKDKHKVPQIVRVRRSPGGSIVLSGIIQLVADGDVHAWTGEVDAKGKIIRDEVGAILPDKGASLEY